jgi:hypothetical protein
MMASSRMAYYHDFATVVRAHQCSTSFLSRHMHDGARKLAMVPRVRASRPVTTTEIG